MEQKNHVHRYCSIDIILQNQFVFVSSIIIRIQPIVPTIIPITPNRNITPFFMAFQLYFPRSFQLEAVLTNVGTNKIRIVDLIAPNNEMNSSKYGNAEANPNMNIFPAIMVRKSIIRSVYPLNLDSKKIDLIISIGK